MRSMGQGPLWSDFVFLSLGFLGHIRQCLRPCVFSVLVRLPGHDDLAGSCHHCPSLFVVCSLKQGRPVPSLRFFLLSLNLYIIVLNS